MAIPKTTKLMVDGVLEDCLVRVDKNGEYAVKARSGRIFYFPEGSDFNEEVKRHNKANGTIPILASEVDDSVDTEWEEWDAAE